MSHYVRMTLTRVNENSHMTESNVLRDLKDGCDG